MSTAHVTQSGIRRIHVKHQGVLEKQKIRGWRKRYFVLENEKLRCYRDERCTDESYMIPVSDIQVSPPMMCNQKFAFEIKTPNKKMLLAADSEASRAEWMRALEASKRMATSHGGSMHRPQCQSIPPISSDEDDDVSNNQHSSHLMSITHPQHSSSIQVPGALELASPTRIGSVSPGKQAGMHLTVQTAISSSSTDSSTSSGHSPGVMGNGSGGDTGRYRRKTLQQQSPGSAPGYVNHASQERLQRKKLLAKKQTHGDKDRFPDDLHPLAVQNVSNSTIVVPDEDDDERDDGLDCFTSVYLANRQSAASMDSGCSTLTRSISGGSTLTRNLEKQLTVQEASEVSSDFSSLTESENECSSTGADCPGGTSQRNSDPSATTTVTAPSLTPERIEELTRKLSKMSFDFQPAPELPHPRLEVTFNSVFDKIRTFLITNRAPNEFYDSNLRGRIFDGKEASSEAIQKLKALIEELDTMI